MLKIINKFPRWAVLQIDTIIVLVTIFLSYQLTLNFELSIEHWNSLLVTIPTICSIKVGMFLITRSYAGIVRYTSINDAKRIFQALTYSLLILLVTNLVVGKTTEKHHFIPYSILLIDYFLSMLFLTAFRIFVKIIYYEWRHFEAEKFNVVIYGAGEAGIITKRTLSQDTNTKYNVIAFVDDDGNKSNKAIEGIPIKNASKLKSIIEGKRIDELILAIHNIDPDRKRTIIEECIGYNLKVRIIPQVERWINGELSVNQLKQVKIEDVLGRQQINLDDKLISNKVSGKVVVVTGAAGSIGSEICRQVLKYGPSKLIALDQAETPLYDLELELISLHRSTNFGVSLCDIRNYAHLNSVFEKERPDIVYHAAAYKHVPLMEANPNQAVITNIQGSKNVADLSIKHQVGHFVMVSTDKAVNPTNVMGASKRIAEIYTQSLNEFLSNQDQNQRTKFITTRFGNVLGSNGSVIPRFRKQIEEGGPVTVTHPEITRYFMTIPEACQLVLQAGAMGNGGEIFLFDMGKSVKIVDLAKRMIKLSGLQLGRDIQLVYTGIRPGEKLYEELLNKEENTIKTNNPKIMVAKVREYSLLEVKNAIGDIIKFAGDNDRHRMVLEMKKLVPEYKSQNSVYESIDAELSSQGIK